MNDAQALVSRGELVQDDSCAVARSVVHGDDFKIGIILDKKGAHRLHDVGLFIKAGNDDRDERSRFEHRRRIRHRRLLLPMEIKIDRADRPDVRHVERVEEDKFLQVFCSRNRAHNQADNEDAEEMVQHYLAGTVRSEMPVSMVWISTWLPAKLSGK